MIKGILLVLYYGALRQSKLVPRTVKSWNPLVQPTRGDAVLSRDMLQVYIKTGKNMQRCGEDRTVRMYRANSPSVCPVVIMHHILSDTPTRKLQDPLFMFPDSRRPVPSSKVACVLHEVMYQIGLGHLSKVTSLHSIRKSAATNAFLQECLETSIRNYGGWSSSAYRCYIQTSNKAVNASLIRSIDP